MASREIEVGDISAPTRKKKKSKSIIGAVVPSSTDRPKTKMNRAARVKKAAALALAKEKKIIKEDQEPIEVPKKKIKKKKKLRRSEIKKADKQNIVDSQETDIDNTTVGQLQNSFETLVERIPNALEEEQEQIGQYRMMFNNLCSMTRTLEKSFQEKPTDRTMYAIIKAYGELREIIADMRALADFSHHSDMIRNTIINPLSEAVAAGLVEYHKAVVGLLRAQMNPNDYAMVETKIKGFAQNAGIIIAENQKTFLGVAEQMFTAGK